MRFYRLTGPNLWGDYGRMLAAGLCRRGERRTDDTPLRLMRTGPFLPPMSLPFRHVVVSDVFRQALVASGAGNFVFQAVTKHKVVRLHWEQWDLEAENPKIYPKRGEPENYVLRGWHSWSAAREMGDVWELKLAKGAITSSQREKGERRTRVCVDSTTWTGEHLFKSNNQGWTLASEVGAELIEQHCGKWITLEPCGNFDDPSVG